MQISPVAGKGGIITQKTHQTQKRQSRDASARLFDRVQRDTEAQIQTGRHKADPAVEVIVTPRTSNKLHPKPLVNNKGKIRI